VGRLIEQIKGISYLLDAYREVSRSAGEVCLLMVGDGRDEARYRAYCQRHGLKNVVFTGFIQQAALPRYYAAADVFVFPTLGDGHGLVVEEAMVSHLPVISTSSAGDIRLRVPDGEAGFVVPPCDSAALAARMAGLARDPALRTRMASAAFERARAQDHDHYARDFERFVDRVLSSPPARADNAAVRGGKGASWNEMTV
jgi:glycosyltransferase involved in cell wall biosynthesis